MVSRSRTVWKQKRGIYTAAEWGEVSVTLADTFTVDNLKATVNPYNVTIIKKTDGSSMTCTYAAGSNVVTITGAGTNIDCIYMAYGVRAQ